MAKKKRKKKKPGHHHAATPIGATEIAASIELILPELAEADAGTVGPLWGQVHKTLLKTEVDRHLINTIIASRDLPGLRDLATRLASGEPIDLDPEPTEDPVIDIPAETMRKAMHAFRKRMKLTRLDHESKLGVGPMTGGRKADVDAILAPREFPDAVWEALVAKGELKSAGGGFYALGDE